MAGRQGPDPCANAQHLRRARNRERHPTYTIRGGGAHGEGLTSVQSNGFDSGEVRQLIAKQDPKGVRDGARLGVCKPSFQTIESG